MKKHLKNLIAIGLILALVAVFTPALMGCLPDVDIAPGAEPSSVIPTRDNTYDLGRSNRQWNDLYLYGYIYTANGTAHVTLPSGNVTLLSTAAASRDNVAMGTVEIQTDSASTPITVSHGLGSTATLVYLTYADDPGNNTAMPYWQSANTTCFYIYTTDNASNTANLTWQAFIAGE